MCRTEYAAAVQIDRVGIRQRLFRRRRFVKNRGGERHWKIGFRSVGAVVQGSVNGHAWWDHWLFPKARGLLVIEMICRGLKRWLECNLDVFSVGPASVGDEEVDGSCFLISLSVDGDIST